MVRELVLSNRVNVLTKELKKRYGEPVETVKAVETKNPRPQKLCGESKWRTHTDAGCVVVGRYCCQTTHG
jgi:hypothetical protein